MFKSKYGLVSVLLVIVATALSWFVVTSRIKNGVQQNAVAQLVRGDQIVRHNEAFNEAQSIALATRAAVQVRPHVNRLWDLRESLKTSILEDMRGFSTTPTLVAVLQKVPEGTKNDVVYLAVIRGTELSTSINAEWITTEEWTKLLRDTKPTPVTPAAPGTIPEAMPVLFPGEEEGQHGMEGKFSIKPVAEAKYVNDTTRVAFKVDIAFMSEGTPAPLAMGELIVAFENADVTIESVERQIMRMARNPMVRSFIPAFELERRKLHQMLTVMSVGTAAAESTTADDSRQPQTGSEYAIAGLNPYFILLNFSNGAVITRDKDDSKTMGFNHVKYAAEVLPSLQRTATTGQPTYDIVEHEAINRFPLEDKPVKLYHAASVPVVDGPKGAFLTMLWPFDVRVLQMQMQTELDLAFFYGRHVFHPSFRGENTIEKNTQLQDSMQGRLTDVKESPLLNTPAGQLMTSRFVFGKEDYLGTYSRFQRMTLTGKPYGYALFTSMDNIRKPFGGIGVIIILLGLFGVILILVLENMVFFYFYNSVDSLNEGIQDVASGNLDFIFGRVSKETEGISNSLNDLLNILLDREAFDEDKAEAPTRTGIQFLVLGKLPDMPLEENDPRVSQLLNAPEEANNAALFQKFQTLWPKLEQEDSAPSREVFMLRLSLFERIVRHQTSCERVFFSLELQEQELVLVPFPVAD